MPTQRELRNAQNNPLIQNYFGENNLRAGKPATHILAAKPLPQNPLGNTSDTAGTERLTADRGCDILSFATMQKELLNKAWGDDWGIFTLEYTTGKKPDDTPLPIITFDIMSRIPSTKKPGLKPRIYVIGPDDMDSDYLIIQHTQWHDCIVEYNICHNTMNEAFELMNKFELFNTIYSGYFKQNGIMEFIFRQEVPTSSTLRIDSTIPSRCVYYDMVIQNIFTQRVKATEEILSVAEVVNQ